MQLGSINEDRQPVFRIGVIADTHVPTRIRALPRQIIDALQGLHVDHILHAGDICVPAVLQELETVAPVSAARGNSDVIFGESLPVVQFLEFNGIQLALTHGCGTMWDYFRDHLIYAIQGYKAERYVKLAAKFANNAQAIVYGHSHRPFKELIGGRLFFNPGSACFGPPEGGSPTIGLLQIDAAGNIQAEIINLPEISRVKPYIRKSPIA